MRHKLTYRSAEGFNLPKVALECLMCFCVNVWTSRAVRLVEAEARSCLKLFFEQSLHAYARTCAQSFLVNIVRTDTYLKNKNFFGDEKCSD